MSNIILTTECPRKCSYCFAKDNANTPMSFQMGNFIKAIDWLSTDTDITPRVGLLGGEPTAHPKFLEFLDYTLSKKLNTLVFTNGMMEEEDIMKVIGIAEKNGVKHTEDFGFCVNVNEFKYRSQKEQRLQTRFLEILGRVSVLSFNIFEEKCDFDFLVDLINQHNMIKSIRFGLAAPLGNRNHFMDPGGYDVIAQKLTDFTALRNKHDIAIGLDCGFPRCMFNKEQKAVIRDSKLDVFSFDCGPTMDIYPNLEVGSCYPLSKLFREKMEDWDTYGKLYFHWLKETDKLEPMYEKCHDCEYFENKSCGGGCRAHKANG